MTAELRRLHAVIYGRVQGVGFRYFVARCAGGEPITGWVRNRPDGAVEVLAEGPEPVLQTLLARMEQGPSGARVSRVDSDWAEASGQHAGFEIRL